MCPWLRRDTAHVSWEQSRAVPLGGPGPGAASQPWHTTVELFHPKVFFFIAPRLGDPVGVNDQALTTLHP